MGRTGAAEGPRPPWHGDRDLELTSGKPIPVADGTLELVEVRPDRVAGEGQSLDPEDYRFGFRFMGGL